MRHILWITITKKPTSNVAKYKNYCIKLSENFKSKDQEESWEWVFAFELYEGDR